MNNENINKDNTEQSREKQYQDALLYIKGIAEDRAKSNDPQILAILLKSIQYVCEDALKAE